MGQGARVRAMGKGLRVAVTGAAGYIGRVTIRRLAQTPGVEQVLALDTRPLPSPHPKVVVLRQSILEPLGDLLARHGVTALVHLAFLYPPGRQGVVAGRINREGLEAVLKACQEAGVRQVLYFSSATVYGAHRDNPIPLTEEAPARPNRGFAYAEEKAAAEGVLRAFALQHPEACVTVLRGCVVLGPTADNFVTGALAKPFLVGVTGCDPPLQYLHEEDLAEAFVRLLQGPLPGVFNIAGEGTVHYSQAARLLGRPLVWLPAPLLYPLTDLAWRLGLQRESPAAGLDLIRWPWVVSTERLRKETGFSPRFTSQEALEAYTKGA